MLHQPRTPNKSTRNIAEYTKLKTPIDNLRTDKGIAKWSKTTKP